MLVSRTAWCERFTHGGLALLMLLALYLHVGAVTWTVIDTPVRGDARDYVAYALNLRLHGVYSRIWPDGTASVPRPDALRQPGYPLFMSALLRPGPRGWQLERVMYTQAGLGVATVLLSFALFRRLLGAGIGLAAAALTAISPHLVNTSVYLLSESLFSFLLALHLLTLDTLLRRRTLRWAAFAGVTLMLTVLTRPTTQYLALVYAVAWLCWPRARRRPDARALLLLLLPVMLATVAWSWRNVEQIGRASDPTLAANFIQHGSYVNLMQDDVPASYGYAYRSDPRNAEMQGRIGPVLGVLFERARAEPGRYLRWFLLGKPMTYLQWNLTDSVGDAFIFPPLASPYSDHALFRLTHAIAHALHPWLMFLALLGMLLALRRGTRDASAALCGLVLGYVLLLHMVGTPLPRYAIPLRPLCYGLALYAVLRFVQRLRPSPPATGQV